MISWFHYHSDKYDGRHLDRFGKEIDQDLWEEYDHDTDRFYWVYGTVSKEFLDARADYYLKRVKDRQNMHRLRALRLSRSARPPT